MSVKTRIVTATLGAALGVAGAVVAYYEGKENRAYRDPVGIVTICYGHTATARLGQTHTDEECDRLLQADLGKAFEAVDRYVRVPLPVERRAALASFVYNVGEGAFRSSTLLRKLNAGDTAGACKELDRWIYAKGQVLPGLVKRRATERELCEVGL